jgi:hypothetical protein
MTWSQDSSVGLTAGYGLDDRGSIFGRGQRFFLSPQRPDQFWDPSNLLQSGYRGAPTGVKCPGREADHSLLSSAEVKNGRVIPPLPPYVLMVWCLIKRRDNFTILNPYSLRRTVKTTTLLVHLTSFNNILNEFLRRHALPVSHVALPM